MVTANEQPQTISSSLAVQRLSENWIDKPKVEPQKAKIIAQMLAGLAAQFHRSEISETQAKMLFQQFAEDLGEYPMQDIDAGIKAYRTDSGNKFFPTSGQLLDRVRREAEARLKNERSRGPNGEQFSVRYAHCNAPICSPKAKAIYGQAMRARGFEP